MNERDEGLIRFLSRERHGTPFEHGYFRFIVKAPLFVVREHHRHRAGHSYNEWSGRYSKMEPEFYVPEFVRTQVGKPGAYTFEPMDDATAAEVRTGIESSYAESYGRYQELLGAGVAKEVARSVLPVGLYTEFYWSINARALMNFLSLRNAAAAQYEIRVYAEAVEHHFAQAMPVTHASFADQGRTAP
jgi:thymidylate synthase (FAD)